VGRASRCVFDHGQKIRALMRSLKGSCCHALFAMFSFMSAIASAVHCMLVSETENAS
jgi:hypothetical protein